MAYGPPDAPFHVIGSRTFPVPADRAMLETLLSELEKAGNTFSEYVANTEAYWRAIHRFRHPDWPDNARAKFEAEIERLRPIVERPPTLLLSIQSCMSDHGLSMLKNNDVLIANKDILAELRSLYREASDALNETPVQEPAAASPPPREDKQPAAVDASGTVTPEAPIPSARPKIQRGRLDESAAIELKKNPALTYKQLANMLGCKPSTLRKREKYPLLAAAKAIVKAERERFRGNSTWRDHQPDDDD